MSVAVHVDDAIGVARVAYEVAFDGGAAEGLALLLGRRERFVAVEVALRGWVAGVGVGLTHVLTGLSSDSGAATRALGVGRTLGGIVNLGAVTLLRGGGRRAGNRETHVGGVGVGSSDCGVRVIVLLSGERSDSEAAALGRREK